MKLMHIDDIPAQIQRKAWATLDAIKNRKQDYTALHGKRLVRDREVISVPLPMGYRMLFRDMPEDPRAFCGVTSHQDYDSIVMGKGPAIKPLKDKPKAVDAMKDLPTLLAACDPALADPAAAHDAAPPAVEVQKPVITVKESAMKITRIRQKPHFENWYRKADVGAEITAEGLAAETGGSTHGAYGVLYEAAKAGLMKRVGDTYVKVGASDATAASGEVDTLLGLVRSSIDEMVAKARATALRDASIDQLLAAIRAKTQGAA